MATPKVPATYDKHLAPLSQLLQSIWEMDDLETIVLSILGYIQSEYQYTLLWVGRYERQKHQLMTQESLLSSGKHLPHQPLAIHPGDILEQVVTQQRPILVANLQKESRAGEWRTLADKFKLQGTIVLPLRRKDTCLGVLLLGSPHWGLTPDTTERTTLFTLASALANALYQHQQAQQRQRTKQLTRPLLSLLEGLDQSTGLTDRLQRLADETHSFIGAASTSVYWLEPKERYFWHRLGNAQRPTGLSNPVNSGLELQATPTTPIPAEEVKGFYKALSNGELVVISEVESALKASLIGPLMPHLQAQSLMAAPILSQGELLGFLCVESNSSRIWNDPEKQYLQGAARLMGLAMPASELEDTITQLRANQVLTAGITQSIRSDQDWHQVLANSAEQLLQHLGTETLIVLLSDPDRGGFEVGYQSHRGLGTVPIRSDWRSLHLVDWQLLQDSQEPVCIEHLEEDLKLIAWRPRFLEMGAKAVMVCNVSPGQSPEGVVLVTDSVSRRWKQTEKQVLKSVSQQVGLILHQWQLQRQADQQAKLQETMQWGLRNLQRLFQAEALEQAATQYLSQLLQVPLVALVTWEPEQAQARVADSVIRDKSFALKTENPISVSGDAIINWALQTDGVLPLNLEDLPDITRQWFCGPHGCQLLLIALRTAPEHVPTGVMILADHGDRRWSEQQMNMLAILINQLAWCRRHLLLTHRLKTRHQQLAILNWYKQHHLDEMQRLLLRSLKRCGADLENNHLDAQAQQQVLKLLQTLLGKLKHLSTHDRWQLNQAYTTMPLVTLLNRLMERMNGLIQHNQLWTKVHCESNLVIGGDIEKIELILSELMIHACERAPAGGRLDIWARPLDQQWLELSITHNGVVDPQLIEALKPQPEADLLASSILYQPPGLNLRISQLLMAHLGGEFKLEQLEDQRMLSRLILPLSKAAEHLPKLAANALTYSSDNPEPAV